MYTIIAAVLAFVAPAFAAEAPSADLTACRTALQIVMKQRENASNTAAQDATQASLTITQLQAKVDELQKKLDEAKPKEK